MIMKSGDYASMLVEHDAKSVVGRSFFCTKILQRKIVTGTVSSNLIFLMTTFHL